MLATVRTPAGYSGRCCNSLFTTPVSLIHDTGVVYKPYIQHRATFATNTLDMEENFTGVSAWCTATIQLSYREAKRTYSRRWFRS